MAITAAVGVLGYAFYFDYRRRNDAAFRERLEQDKSEANRKETEKVPESEEPANNPKKKKDKKKKVKIEELAEVEEAPGMMPGGTASDLNAMLMENQAFVDLSIEELRTLSADDQQKTFYSLLVKGEVLMSSGEAGRKKCVDYFVKAALLAPNPVDVLTAFNQTLTQDVYRQVIAKFSETGIKKRQSYLDQIVSGQNNFKFVMRPMESQNIDDELEWNPVAIRDIPGGTELLRESPDIAQVNEERDPAERCEKCLKRISGQVFHCDGCGLGDYCSLDCRNAAMTSMHLFVCSALKPEAAKSYATYLTATQGRLIPRLMLRYLSLLLSEELKSKGSNPSNTFLHYDHLRPILREPTKQDRREAQMLRDLFCITDPNMGDFLKDEIYACMKATVMGHAFGIPSKEYEDLQVSIEAGSEPVRLAGDTKYASLIGLYHTLAHLPHSCKANCEVYSPDGFNMVLRTTKNVKKGEHLSISYAKFDPSLGNKTRHELLMKRFYYDCSCSLCEEGLKS